LYIYFVKAANLKPALNGLIMEKQLFANELQIAFTQKNPGVQKTIFFIHGNSGSSRAWRKQVADPIFSGYRIFTIDLPAHGDSTHSSKPAEDYSLPGMSKVIAQTIEKAAGDAPFILVGLSLGSNVIAEALKFIKPKGMAIVSTSVIGGDYTTAQAFQEGVDVVTFFSDEATEEKINKFGRDMSFFDDADEQEIAISDYKIVRQKLRPTLMQTAMEGNFSDEIEMLKHYERPVLVVFGEKDVLANIHYLDKKPFKTWNDKIYKIPEAGHAVQLDQPQKFNEMLVAYAKEMLG
jgi:pimeloyl-ACP methyl ester carboxylesterase